MTNSMQIPETEITNLLRLLAETPARLAAMTSTLKSERLERKVNDDEWTVNEVLAHLRVCAEVWGQSILVMISQEQPTLRYVSPRTVAKKRNYAFQPFGASLLAFSRQRHELIQRLRALAQEGWSRGATFTGTTRGRTQTIRSYVQRMVDHEAAHLAQIEQILHEAKS